MAMMFATRAVSPESGSQGVGFLHADVEPVQPQLIDQVGPGGGVGGSADRPAANRAGQPLHVRPGVVDAERHGAPASAARRDQRDDEGRDAADRRRMAHRAEPTP